VIGAKVKLLMLTTGAEAVAGAAMGVAYAAPQRAAATAASGSKAWRREAGKRVKDRTPEWVGTAQPARDVSTSASGASERTTLTSRTPSTLRSCSAGTFIGPGDGASPGAGCGK